MPVRPARRQNRQVPRDSHSPCGQSRIAAVPAKSRIPYSLLAARCSSTRSRVALPFLSCDHESAVSSGRRSFVRARSRIVPPCALRPGFRIHIREQKCKRRDRERETDLRPSRKLLKGPVSVRPSTRHDPPRSPGRVSRSTLMMRASWIRDQNSPRSDVRSRDWNVNYCAWVRLFFLLLANYLQQRLSSVSAHLAV